MSTNTIHRSPSPVGGVPLPGDFGPSILFSLLFALLVPVAIWRVAKPKTRSYALIWTIPLCAERVVMYALRAHAAHDEALRTSKGFQLYFQASLGNGFISMGQDLLLLLRTGLVYSTLGTSMRRAMKLNRGPNTTPAERDPQGSSGTMRVESNAQDEVADHPRTRAWIRRICDIAGLCFVATVVVMVVAAVEYKKVMASGEHAELVRKLWYAGNTMAICLLLAIAHGAAWAFLRMPRVPRNAALWTLLVASLLAVVGCYRLWVLRWSTPSLFSGTSESQNTPGTKAGFYIFHAAPEYLAAAILVSLNVRGVYATGLWGDRRGSDPQPSK